MAKDYAKNHKDRNRKGNKKKVTHKDSKSTISKGLWIFTALVIALFIVGINKLKNEKDFLQNIAMEKLNAEKATNVAKKEKPQKPHAKPITTAEQNQPKFDFYNELPKMKVWVPPKDEQSEPVAKPPIIPTPASPGDQNTITSNSSSTPSTEATNTASSTIVKTPQNENNHYYLQIAAFKNFADADSLKATLTLQGYDVSIKSQKSINRVYIGPFTNVSDANKAKANLASQQIHSIIVKQET